MAALLKATLIIRTNVLLALVSVVIFPVTVFAADLTVIDSLGLVRAMKSVDTSGRVIVEVVLPEANGNPKPLLLSNTDGMAPDIVGTRDSQNGYVFEGVSPGTWEIRVRDSKVQIKSVKILK